MKQYTITLADGRQLCNLRKNGTNFVSQERVAEELLEGNLSQIQISDGVYSRSLRNVVLLQQCHMPQAEPAGWYLAFRQRTERELSEMALDAKLTYLAMMTGVEI